MRENIKSILLTGASGFLGRQLIAAWGEKYNLTTVGRTPLRGVENIYFDFSKQECPRFPKVNLVIHAAGKAHMVPQKDHEKRAFFDINVEGTRRFLAGLEAGALPESFIFVSSIAVYGKESGEEIDEFETLSANDPYGLSKVEAEQLILDWGKKHSVNVGILRLPLLLGKNAPGNFGAMVDAIKKGRFLNIGKGEAKKSMLLASDVAEVIPQLYKKGGVYNLTDGYHPSFKELSEAIARAAGRPKMFTIPYQVAKMMAKSGDLLESILGHKSPLNSHSFNKMTKSLTFSDDKARRELSWNPCQVLKAIPKIV